MKRRLQNLRLPLLGVAAFVVALTATLVTRPPATSSPAQRPKPAAAAATAPGAAPPATATGAAAENAAPTLLSAADTQRLIDEALGSDAQHRAAAIEALGHAPRALALPALRRIVKTGEPSVDRHLALGALHALATGQGDADGAIRTLLRDLIYDGNDEAVTDNATAALASLDTLLGA